MRLHRFFVNPHKHPLKQLMWLRDANLINQWQRVLRYRAGQQIVLFDGVEHERMYKITEFDNGAAHLELVTEMVRQLPRKDIYLAWALLKKDKNDWVLQKCTELGVNHFIPLLTERCEKTGFNEERAQKIIIEAAEQCGRGNIPTVREPIQLVTLFDEFVGKIPVMVCEQDGQKLDTAVEKLVVVVGPEGGWSEAEKQLFKDQDVQLVTIGDFTHRAETASVAAISKLL
jgi:16S rRNA (uracil1498-N3)-methyltransferase